MLGAHVDFNAVFYVRTIASRLNEAFRYARDKLLTDTLATSLSISTILEDFKLPEPEPDELTKLFRNIGTGIYLILRLVDVKLT